MMMKLGPGAAFKMVEAEIMFGALQIVFDLPATATKRQQTRFIERSMQAGEGVMIGLGGVSRPVNR